MGKFAVGTEVRVTDDVPDSVMPFIGRVGKIYDKHNETEWNLVEFSGGYKLGFRDEELVFVEEEPVSVEEHLLVGREELEERFVRQRNTIQHLQEELAGLKSKQEEPELKRVRYVIFEGLPVSSYYQFIESAQQAAASLAEDHRKNYTVVQFEMLDDYTAPFLVASYQGVVMKTLEEADRENEEN